MLTTIACGPFFDLVGLGTSLVSLLVIKPVTYFIFALAFRYRVATDRPLSRREVLGVATVRAGCGLLLIFATAMIFSMFRMDTFSEFGWVVLSGERVIVWGSLGFAMVKLRGRRLVGWTLSGTAIDLAFDLGISAAFKGENIYLFLAIGGVGVFLATLYAIGRRPSLKARFFAPNLCRQCAYDLTGCPGPLCPECGTDFQAGSIITSAMPQ